MSSFFNFLNLAFQSLFPLYRVWSDLFYFCNYLSSICVSFRWRDYLRVCVVTSMLHLRIYNYLYFRCQGVLC